MKIKISVSKDKETTSAKPSNGKSQKPADIPKDKKPKTLVEENKPVSVEQPKEEKEDVMDFNFEEASATLAQKALQRTGRRSQAKIRLNSNRMLKEVAAKQHNFRDAMADLEDPKFK